jgi:hypothetical protein
VDEEGAREEEGVAVAISSLSLVDLDLNVRRYLTPALLAVDVSLPPRFDIRRVDSFPRAFFDQLDDKERSKFVFMHSTPLWVETRMSKPKLLNPHALIVNRVTETLLSMNIKFIPRPRIDAVAPLQDWEKFTRSVRIKYFFREHTNARAFNPKFHVPASSDWQPPESSSSIEFGLKLGFTMLTRAIGSINRSVWRPNISGKTLDSLEELYRSGDMLVKPADKNLGLTILSKEWYISEGFRQLNDSKTYLEIKDPEYWLDHVLSERRRLVKHWSEHPSLRELFTPQINRFLAVYDEETSVFPEFHHLPKLHKTPLKGRPIVPSHSWATTNVSVFIDSLLQPLISEYPWIIRDSKHLLRQLAPIRFEPLEEIWIITADMSSMYTNLPSEEGVRILDYLGTAFYGSKPMGELLRSLTALVLQNNYLSFQGKYYHQVSGTAMGTALAPTYANLFVAAYEKELDVPHSPGLLYYGRYIDDVLAIARGSRDVVDAFIKVLNAIHPALNFEVEASQVGLPFLDAFVQVDRASSAIGSGRIVTRVYQKPLNAYQYIPWSSYHPNSVKLAFVKGELIRYVRLSSFESDFIQIRRDFWLRLRARGYPIRWLRKAFSVVSYSTCRDRSLIDRPKETLAEGSSLPLVVHHTYNPIWDQVNGSKIITSTVRQWSATDRRFFNPKSSRPIRAAHRARNLSDIVNKQNKKLLATGPSEHKSRRLV